MCVNFKVGSPSILRFVTFWCVGMKNLVVKEVLSGGPGEMQGLISISLIACVGAETLISRGHEYSWKCPQVGRHVSMILVAWGMVL